MRSSRRQFLAMSGGWLLATVCPAAERQVLSLGGPAFGSYWRISLADGAAGPQLRRRIENLIHSVDSAMSPYRRHSEIGRFNAAASRDWLPVSAPVRKVVAAALQIADETGGAFDPTVGPVVARYGFGPITGKLAGTYHQLQLSADSLRKHEPALTIDLCGIAKGHALDRMVGVLTAAGVTDYLIELGGEVRAAGRHPTGRRWQVAIERPAPGTPLLSHIIAVDGRAVATSGDAINGYEIAGRRYSHIIDPRKHEPVTGAIASVSVLAGAAMRADALATGLMAMGLETGAAFAEDHGIDALFLARDGTNLKTILTARFADSLLT